MSLLLDCETLCRRLNRREYDIHDEEPGYDGWPRRPQHLFRMTLKSNLVRVGVELHVLDRSSAGCLGLSSSELLATAEERANKMSLEKRIQAVSDHIIHYSDESSAMSFSFSMLWTLFYAAAQFDYLSARYRGTASQLVICWAEEGPAMIHYHPHPHHGIHYPSLSPSSCSLMGNDPDSVKARRFSAMACEAVALHPVQLHRFSSYAEVRKRLPAWLNGLLDNVRFTAEYEGDKRATYAEFDRRVAQELIRRPLERERWARWVRSPMPQVQDWRSDLRKEDINFLFVTSEAPRPVIVPQHVPPHTVVPKAVVAKGAGGKGSVDPSSLQLFDMLSKLTSALSLEGRQEDEDA